MSTRVPPQGDPAADGDATTLVLVAAIGAPHGVRGECRLKSFTQDPVAVARYGPLRSADGRVRLSVASARLLRDDLLVVRFDGVSTREAAAALTGMHLHVARTALPEPDEEEFYHADLIGLRVETPDGAVHGRISAVLNHGAGDMIEVRSGEGEPTLLVPFTRAFVPVVDLPGGRVVATPEALETGPDAPDEA